MSAPEPTPTMLDELEKLAREATAPPWIVREGRWWYGDNAECGHVIESGISNDEVCGVFDEKSPSAPDAAYICALVNAAPLLLAAVRAAEEVERWSQVHGVETVKDVAMDALRSALAALKGST